MSILHKGSKRNGQWTEIYTRREKDIPGHYELSEGRDHAQGWACTCGCNKRIPQRKHSDGAPREVCDAGFTIKTPASTQSYRDNYARTFGHE